MTSYDIYIGTNGSEATDHGAEFTYDGLNPADALSKFVADPEAMADARARHADLTELAAFDDGMNASISPLDDGSFELHIYADETDTAITIPPTEFTSITDAADMLDVSRQRVHAMLRGGQLAGRMVGNAWMVSKASVNARLKA